MKLNSYSKFLSNDFILLESKWHTKLGVLGHVYKINVTACVYNVSCLPSLKQTTYKILEIKRWRRKTDRQEDNRVWQGGEFSWISMLRFVYYVRISCVFILLPCGKGLLCNFDSVYTCVCVCLTMFYQFVFILLRMLKKKKYFQIVE